MTSAPAKNPCGTCPYRRDVPSGVWAPEEYAKLPNYDKDTGSQPMGVFHCHQQDGRVCAGWCGTHDMHETLAIRLASAMGTLADDVLDEILDYSTEVPLFESGTAAFVHGMTDVADPSPAARRKIDTLERKRDDRRRVQ